jgi:hypothetical protein
MISGMVDHDDDSPKSALEVAMARLRQKDADSGESEQPLSDAQKAQIAEVRQAAQAKLAQEDIMFKSSLAQARDPEALATLQANHRRDLQRIQDDRDSKIAKIRRTP